jgi:hypothetical protein
MFFRQFLDSGLNVIIFFTHKFYLSSFLLFYADSFALYGADFTKDYEIGVITND